MSSPYGTKCDSINPRTGVRCRYDLGHKGKHKAMGRAGWS